MIRPGNLLAAARACLLPALALFAAALLPACGDVPLPGPSGVDGLPGLPTDGTHTQARDTYPFTAEGYVIHWTPGASILVEIPTCGPVAGCFPGIFPPMVEGGIRAWDPIHAMLGITVTFSSVPVANDVLVVWDDGYGSSTFPIGPGVIGFAAVLEQPADPSRIIVMTTQCNVCGPGASHDPNTLFIASVHEWGHMLGIWNHSYDPVDLMHPILKDPAFISNRDVQTLLQAYSLAPALDLSTLPKQATSARAPADFLIRYLHRHLTDGGTTLEFNPP